MCLLVLALEAESTVRTCQGSQHCCGSQQLPGAPRAGLDAGSAQALSCQPGISHSLQHLTLDLFWRKGQPPNPAGTGTALLWDAHAHLDWKTSQPLYAMRPCPSQLLSQPPLLIQLPMMSQEQPELPRDIPHPWQLSPLRAQPILYPPGWEERLPQDPLYAKALHIHPSLPGHAQHSLENITEGKPQSSPLLPPASSSVQAGQCTRRGNYENTYLS